MALHMIKKVPTPDEIRETHPMGAELVKIKTERDAEIRKVFTGESDKFLAIIGPCSADYEDSVLDYLCRLSKVQEKVKDKIIIIPRIYTNKPRTSGEGYKGMLHQPNPNGKEDMLEGLISIRKLHLEALEKYGFTCADEMLYPENHRYLSDILCYVAVGARSVEDQQHRLTASGINVPVGMKNPTSGDLSVMLNSIKASQNPHMFIYRGWEVETKGNIYSHAILRGYVNKMGESMSNYHYEDLLYLNKLYKSFDVKNPSCIIDCNHSNSNKQYLEQIRIAKDVLHSMNENQEIYHLVKGLMIESYLVDGKQDINECIYGKSITDPCIGWKKTYDLLMKIANDWNII